MEIDEGRTSRLRGTRKFGDTCSRLGMVLNRDARVVELVERTKGL